jgi:hypothetical protein
MSTTRGPLRLTRAHTRPGAVSSRSPSRAMVPPPASSQTSSPSVNGHQSPIGTSTTRPGASTARTDGPDPTST